MKTLEILAAALDYVEQATLEGDPLPEWYNEGRALCERDKPYRGCRQTACRICGQDIEGNHVENDWRDRGNNSTCPHPGDGKQLHSPAREA